MTSPPPILPPLRSLGIDFPGSVHALEHIPFTTQPNLNMSDNNNANQPMQGLSGILQPAVDQPQVEAPSFIPEHDEEDDDSDGEGDDNEDRDDDDEGDSENDGPEEGLNDLYPWQPIIEDTTIPCQDELAFIESKEEYSAEDHTHWEKETFFDLEDPDLKPLEHGRIEWHIAAFNGTKEKPNKQLIMKSQIVRIGDYDWQIKMYPKGGRSEYMSVYVECLTMSSQDYVDPIESQHPPLPVLAGTPRFKRRVSVPAQIGVVMYNPAEPRVYHYKADAHQYHKQSSDFGWRYFTDRTHHEFHLRQHLQRQAILKNDNLSFTAYIRLINDPTNSLWERPIPGEALSPSTSLTSFGGSSPRLSAYLLLFHLAPFRKWLYNTKSTCSTIIALQHALEKFLARKLERKHLRHQGIPSGCDIVSVWHGLRASLVKDATSQDVSDFDTILGGLDPKEQPICSNRLLTSLYHNLQTAIDAQKDTPSAPAVLSIEIERQNFNKHKRKWEKISKPVHLQDKLTYGGAMYTLYAFVTHSGELGNNDYVPYIRPGGLMGLWYAYESNHVKCLTPFAAEKRQIGASEACFKVTPQLALHDDLLKSKERGVAYLAMYVRQDAYESVFSTPAEEVWHRGEVQKDRTRSNAKSGRTALAEVKAPQAHQTPLPSPHPRAPLLADMMDGDDVIMSDVEDDSTGAYSITEVQHASSGAVQEKEKHNRTQLKCINYFSGPYYNGAVLADGKYHGQGHLVSTNGDDYTGRFKHGKPHGTGTMVYGQSGDVYTGEWRDGQQHGHGKLIEKESNNVYEGGWREGRRHGQFVLRGTVTDDDKAYCQICYEREMCIAFYDCGHVAACKVCAAAIQQCPICRKKVLTRLELFGVKLSMQ